MAMEMSSDDLRAHLYRSLQGKGVLDSLKSQLRNRLARELQNTLEGRGESSSPVPAIRGQSSMTVQVANSMVAEYLQKVGFEFTLSIFLPEAGVNVGKLFTSEDLMRFMKIPPSCSLQPQNEQGFLVQLIEGLATQEIGQAPARTCVAVQTEEKDQKSASATPSVAAKLQALDESYAHKAEEEARKSQQAIEERMATFQRECERQYQRQLEAEMAHFRERELAQMREEERERCEEEVGRVREELQGTHRQKLEAVRKMELETLQRLRRKEQELEAGVYSQRQALLEEMEVLKMRETELKRQAELNRQAASLEEERVRSLMEQLAGREKALGEMREQYERMVEERMSKYKLECDAGLQSKKNELARWEADLRAGQQQLSYLQSESQRLGAELREEKGKTESLQGLLHEATTQQVALQHQKDALQERVDQVGDYQHLKQRTSELQRQLLAAERKFSEAKSDHRRRSSELQQLVKQLQARLAQPSHELCTLQSELEQMRKTHHKEMLAIECDNKHLRRQLAVQSESYLALQQQLDERTVQLRSMQREVEDLQSQLELLHTTFVPGGRGRREVVGAKGAGAEGKSSLLQSKKTASAGPKLTAGLRKSITHSLPHKPLVPYSEDLSTLLGSHDVSFSDSSGQFLAETRATFARLEKEAEELDKSYREFQLRLAPGISILQEPIAHSPLLENDVTFLAKELGGMATPRLSNGSVPSGRGGGPIPFQETQMPQTTAALYASPSNWPASDHHSNENEFELVSPSMMITPSAVITRSNETMHRRVPQPSPHPPPTLLGKFQLQLASTQVLTESQPASVCIPAVQTCPAATTQQTEATCSSPSPPSTATASSSTRFPHALAHTQLTTATSTLVSAREVSGPQMLLPPASFSSTVTKSKPLGVATSTAATSVSAFPSATSKPPLAAAFSTAYSSATSKLPIAASTAGTSVSAFPSATSEPPSAAAFSTAYSSAASKPPIAMSTATNAAFPSATSKPTQTAAFSTAIPSITTKPPISTTAAFTFPSTTSKPPIATTTYVCYASSTMFAVESSPLPSQATVHPTTTSAEVYVSETLMTSPVPAAGMVLESQQTTEKLIQPTSLDPGKKDSRQIVQVSSVPEPPITTAGPGVVPAKPTPRVSLDDLWTSSTSPLQNRTAEKPGREPRTPTPAGSLEDSWETVRRQKEEEKERREQEEEDRVQRELELLQSEEPKAQETHDCHEPHKPMSPPSEGRRETTTDSQRRPKCSMVEKEKEEEEGEEEEEGVDPVMLKYMELVRQRREQQDHSRGEEKKPALGLEHGEREPLSAHSNGKDYGLPSLSQGSDRSFGGYSDHDDPFEDW